MRWTYVLLISATVLARVHARLGDREQGGFEPPVMCEEIRKDGQGLACTLRNACVQLADYFDDHKISVYLPPLSRIKTFPRPRYVLVHSRDWFTMPDYGRYGRVNVEFIPTRSETVRGRDWISGTHVVVEHTCWNYGHFLYDSLIPIHRMFRTKSRGLGKNSPGITIWNLQARTQETCNGFYEDGVLPGFTFLNMKESKCFKELVVGLSVDWSLESNYHPDRFVGPDPKQYPAFRDDFVNSFKREREESPAILSPDKERKLLFVDRLDNRQIRNKDEFLSFLGKRLGGGWTVEKVVFDHMSMSEQALKIYKADVVLGFAGTGITNSVAGKDGVRVIEILSSGMHDFHTNHFKKMVHVCHSVYRASPEETFFAPTSTLPMSAETFKTLAATKEQWDNEDSFNVWHKSSAVEVDPKRFWDEKGNFLTSNSCNSWTQR